MAACTDAEAVVRAYANLNSSTPELGLDRDVEVGNEKTDSSDDEGVRTQTTDSEPMVASGGVLGPTRVRAANCWTAGERTAGALMLVGGVVMRIILDVCCRRRSVGLRELGINIGIGVSPGTPTSPTPLQPGNLHFNHSNHHFNFFTQP